MVKKAQEARVDINKSQLKKIKKMYSEIAKDLENQLKTVKKDSLTERWLKDYQKQFKKAVQELNVVLAKDIKDNMGKAATLPVNMQMKLFNTIDSKYSLDSSAHFSNMFSRIPTEVLGELVNGKFYKDGRGLSPRIWGNAQKANADIDYIIQKGIAAKKSVYDLANDLVTHINPDSKKSWDFKKLYPSVGNRQIDYNAARLAVTSISHAYQLSMQRSCKANPFVEKIEWHTSNSHRTPCATCQSREGKQYDPDKLPLDHPWGVCYFTPVIEKSMSDVASELKDWMNGGSNEKLDSLFKDKYGKVEFKKEEIKPQSKVEKPKKELPLSDRLLDLRNYFNNDEWRDIYKAIESSPKFMQDWIVKYQNELKFDTVEAAPEQGAHFSRNTKGITINLERDAKNTRGKYSTFFHEFGHLLDHSSRELVKVEGSKKYTFSPYPSNNPDFIKAIKEDYQDMLNSDRFKNKPEVFVRNKLIELLRKEGDLASGVQDAYSGLTLNKVRPNWGHSTEYWTRGDTDKEIASETFANMSAAYTNPEVLAKMQKWFPKSCKEFENIIQKIVDTE